MKIIKIADDMFPEMRKPTQQTPFNDLPLGTRVKVKDHMEAEAILGERYLDIKSSYEARIAYKDSQWLPGGRRSSIHADSIAEVVSQQNGNVGNNQAINKIKEIVTSFGGRILQEEGGRITVEVPTQ